ncbi:Lypoyltransferase mitochondrial-like [Klebsormidium nitens]|uniref:lipoyl(octanoyl) transferase n=1 Tax=Klebsormidium nitens TaxID=105231 RepID=A0A1Y1HPL7_KLENI|nr:Lypoyltransferase mitochondrial-like [Klebsormidium nitens]|eukprot:GAQ78556.1 Lypoyltransferase mitochondrial-like [Klebsormidium nitens]
MAHKALQIMRLGRIPYGAGLRIQETLFSLRTQKSVPDTLLALEHPPVYTVILYPILNLHEAKIGARAYVEGLEEVMVQTAGVWGVKARGKVPAETGVWVEDRKIGAVGVRISRGVTSHGLALNATVDLGWFEHIVPCGIADKEVTSLERETGGAEVRFDDVMRESMRAFCRVFGYQHP